MDGRTQPADPSDGQPGSTRRRCGHPTCPPAVCAAQLTYVYLGQSDLTPDERRGMPEGPSGGDDDDDDMPMPEPGLRGPLERRAEELVSGLRSIGNDRDVVSSFGREPPAGLAGDWWQVLRAEFHLWHRGVMNMPRWAQDLGPTTWYICLRVVEPPRSFDSVRCRRRLWTALGAHMALLQRQDSASAGPVPRPSLLVHVLEAHLPERHAASEQPPFSLAQVEAAIEACRPMEWHLDE